MELTRMHPKVTVRLSADSTPRLLAAVIDGGLDAALVLARTGAPWPAGTRAAPIANDQLVAVAPQSLRVNTRTPFEALFDRPWVLNPDGCGYRALLVSLAATMRRQIHVVAEVQGASLQRELVVAGVGVGLVPEAIARAWMSQKPVTKDLVALRPKDAPFSITAAVVSTETTQRLCRPIETKNSALIEVFAAARAAA